jgi:ATP-binding cassette subfamily B protein
MESPDLPHHPHLLESWLFQSLSPEVREQLAAKAKYRTFTFGQALFSDDELPDSIHFVVQGRVRVLGSFQYESPTLALLEPGEWVGWTQLLRRTASGSAQAAIDPNSNSAGVMTISISADDFEEIAIEHFSPQLACRTDASELFDVLVRYRATFATRFELADVKALVGQVLRSQNARLVNWLPSHQDTDAIVPQLSPNLLWLISSSGKQSIGTVVDRNSHLEPPSNSVFPVRIVGLDRTMVASFLDLDLSGQAVVAPAKPSALGVERLGYEFPSGGLPRRVIKQFQSKSYPIKRSQSANLVEDTIACFTMLYSYLKVPFQPDSLRQWLYGTDTQTVTLELCGKVAEIFSVNAKLIKFTPTAQGINRMDVPAMIPWGDGLAVLYEVSPEAVVIGSPRDGLLTLSPQQVAGYVVIDSETQTSRGLVLERTSSTALQKFGLSWFLPSVMRYRWALIQVLVSSIFVQILGIASPLIIQQIFDKVIIGGNPGALPVFGFLLLAVSIFAALLEVFRTWQFVDTSNRIDLGLGTEVIRHLLNLPLSYFEKRSVGELSARIGELENIRQFLTGQTLTVVLDALFSVVYIAVMLVYSVQLTIVALVSVPITIASTLLISPLLQRLIQTRADHNAKTQSYLIEILSGIFTVKAQNIESMVRASWRERYVKFVSTGFQAIMLNTGFSSFSNLINTLSELLVLSYGASLVVNNELTLGGLIAFRIIAGHVTGPLLRLAQLWERFQEVRLSMDLVGDIIDSPAEILPIDESQLFMPTIKGDVAYKDINFGFTSGKLQLININLEFKNQPFVGIVGQSGSGKSTLTKLLPRLYLPNSGSIYVDGYDISKVSLPSLRSQIGIVPQESVLLQGTIRQNITLFSDATDEKVIDAAKVAAAHDFIMSLENGYNTQVGERGSSLSGGQRQRIAIAQMVFQNPRLLIMDEATSALDYTTEKQVCDNLKQRFKGRTVFFITHRLATLGNADEILLMQNGVVAERGTHNDLMARRQLYYFLYSQQAQSAETVLTG